MKAWGDFLRRQPPLLNFSIGLLLFALTWRLDRFALPHESTTIFYLIPIGFIGAYSTFSTFEWEIFSNLNSGAFWIAILYVTTSLIFGLVAVALGAALGRVLS